MRDSVIFARLAQLGLHKLAQFEAGDNDAGRVVLEISVILREVIAQLLAASEPEQFGQYVDIDETAPAHVRTERRRSRDLALRILAAHPRLC